MRLPPSIITIRFQAKSWRMPRLWIPIFLLWPLLALLFVFLFFAGVIFTLAMRSPQQICRSLSAFYDIFCEMRGTRVDVDGHHKRVLITIH